jgi:tetratricopeptide (TPR) repeat protein
VSARPRRLAVVLGVPLLVFAGAEWGARAAGLDPRERPRWLMFKDVQRWGVPCFQRDPKEDKPWHPPYRVDKPEGRLRVACIGGSTVQTFDEAAFPRVLEHLLRRAVAPREAEVISAGAGGMYSDGELAVLRELIDRDLDAVVLYSLHNEFHPQNQRTLLAGHHQPWRARLRRGLGTFALGRLLMERLAPPSTPEPSVADRQPDHRPIDGPEYGLVVENFRGNLDDFYALCRSRGVPLLVCTAVCNLREFPPMADVFDPSTGEEERARWEALVDEAAGAAEAGAADRALALLREAEVLDDKPARLSFVRGQALIAAGRLQDARASLARARDCDGRISRGVSELQQAVRDMAGRPGLTIVDVEGAFDAVAAHGITGHELVVDNVHPSIKGNGYLAATILRAMADARLFTTPEQLQARGLYEPDAVLETLVDSGEMDLRAALNKLQLVLEKGRWDDTAERARADLLAVLRADPERVEALVGLGLLEGLASRTPVSRECFQRALRRDATALDHYRQRALISPFIRSILNRAGVLAPGQALQDG